MPRTKRDRLGVIESTSHRGGYRYANSVLVKWDGCQYAEPYHKSFIEELDADGNVKPWEKLVRAPRIRRRRTMEQRTFAHLIGDKK
jgi:hypothetical protein